MPFDARAVLFDAGGTLLQPSVDIADAYLREARALDLDLDERAFRARLAAVWQQFRATPAPDHELETSDQDERAMWSRLTAEVAAPFAELAVSLQLDAA